MHILARSPKKEASRTNRTTKEWTEQFRGVTEVVAPKLADGRRPQPKSERVRQDRPSKTTFCPKTQPASMFQQFKRVLRHLFFALLYEQVLEKAALFNTHTSCTHSFAAFAAWSVTISTFPTGATLYMPLSCACGQHLLILVLLEGSISSFFWMSCGEKWSFAK